ncbi:MAG: DUF1844 domain-containing protein [Myxococcota bacterium]
MPPDEPKPGPGFTIVDKRGRESEPEPAPAAPPLPKADFSALVLSLATSTLFHLGLVAEPETGKPGEKNLPLARHSIDTLELLEQKTQGNLTGEEAELLAKLLTELRVHYVEASRG